MTIRRRMLLQAAAAAALPMPLSMPAIAKDTRASTLRFVPSTDLVSLDPVFSTALVAVEHGYLVFDTLYGVDAQMRPQPQMAEGAETSDDGRTWTIRLRDGLRFHDNTPVRAADCAASLQRWGKRDPFGRALAAAVDRYEAADDRTLRIHLKTPFPRLLDAIGKPHSLPAFIMPERIVQATPDGQAVKEMVGSGPYRFLPGEWSSGNLIAYARFDGYVPRAGAPEWTSGGKVAHFDRVEWHVIPDQATAVAALQQGEVDWLENVSPDLMPLVAGSADMRMQNADPLGTELVLRFNSTQPPFDKPALRRLVMQVASQADYLAADTGNDPKSYQVCKSFFPCTLPGVQQVAAGQFNADPAKMRDALKQAGYGGEKVVILNPSDSAPLAPLGPITADLLKRLGMNVDLQDMDWGTLLSRRNSHAPSDAGGWSIYHSTWPSIAIANPVLNTTIRGDGAAGWPGWFSSPEMEHDVAAWLAAGTDAERDRLFADVQQIALREVPSLPLGLTFPRTAYRSDLKGVLGGSVRYFWNVQRD